MCGKPVSGEVPFDIVIGAWIECSECLIRGNDTLRRAKMGKSRADRFTDTSKDRKGRSSKKDKAKSKQERDRM